MRFLFTTIPALAHFHLTVPIAHALVQAGHEVAFAAAKSFGLFVRNAGLPCFTAGLDWLADDTGKAFPDWHEVPEKERGRFDVGVIFAQRSPPPMIDDLLRIAQDWKPDLIVRDMWDFGGGLAAEKLSIPYAVMGISGGVFLSHDAMRDLIQQPLDEIRGRKSCENDCCHRICPGSRRFIRSS